MHIGIIGSRRRDSAHDLSQVRSALVSVIVSGKEIAPTIVSGGCPKGGDRFAEILAKEFKLSIIIYRAEWRKYGKAAGFIRNTYIAEDSDVLIACVAEDRTGGTEDTIKKFKNLHPNNHLILV